MSRYRYYIVVSTGPDLNHLIERTDDVDPKLRPGVQLTQKDLENLRHAGTHEITLTRRKA